MVGSHTLLRVHWRKIPYFLALLCLHVFGPLSRSRAAEWAHNISISCACGLAESNQRTQVHKSPGSGQANVVSMVYTILTDLVNTTHMHPEILSCISLSNP